MELRFDNTIHAISTCPQTHDGWVHHWQGFPFQCTWLWDNNDGNGGKGFVYDEKDIINNFDFKGTVSPKHYWNSYGNRNIIWFYAHMRMLNYYISNPTKDWYWFYDDDVTCDKWKEFISSFKDVDLDFISWFVFSKEDYGNGVPDLDENTTSQHMWFERFPGHGDILPNEITQWYGSFFPVVRYSNKALKELVEINKYGYLGYSEGFVPTILNWKGYKIASLFNKDGTSNFYDVTKINLKHKHQNIGWSWI